MYSNHTFPYVLSNPPTNSEKNVLKAYVPIRSMQPSRSSRLISYVPTRSGYVPTNSAYEFERKLFLGQPAAHRNAAQTLRKWHQCRRGTAESRAGSSFALSTAQRESQRPQGVRTRTPEDRSRAVVGASDTRIHSVRKCADQAGIASLLLCRGPRSLRPFAQPGLRVVRLFLLRDGPENRGRSSHPSFFASLI